MARASSPEKCLTKSPYLPSFEYWTRLRHRGLAIARISSSVFPMMFTRGLPPSEETGFAGLTTDDMRGFSGISLLVVRHQVIARRFLHGVLAGLRVAPRNSQHVPVRVVHFHGVAPVVVA